QEFKMTTQTELEWQWLVRDVDAEGVASLEMKLTAVRMEINGKSFDFSYNSGRANTTDDDYKKRLINLLDQVRYAGSYTVRLKADGQVVEVRGLSKILDDTNPGLNLLDFAVPQSARLGPTYVRFRVSTTYRLVLGERPWSWHQDDVLMGTWSPAKGCK